MEFNYIPGNLVAPIIAFEVNSGGQFENQSRILLIGHKSAAGSAVNDVPVPCFTERDARQLAGSGSMLDDMFRTARRNAPAQEIWILPVAAAGTANVRTITVGVPVAGAGILEIAGQPVQLTMATGDSANSVATALAAAVNAYFNPFDDASLPVTASVAANVVTVTNRHLGAHGAEIDMYVPVLATGNAFSGVLTIATTVPGTGAPSLTAGLAGLGDEPFDWIISGFSDDTNVGSLKTFLADVSGRWAWNRGIYGHAFYGKEDTSGNLTTSGLAQDNRHVTIIPRIAGGGYYEPTWVWAAEMAARVVPWLSDGANGNVSRNQTGLRMSGLRAPRDRTKWLDYATREAFLKSGLSTWTASVSGGVQIDKIITTQRTINSVADTTFRDVQKIGQLIYALRKFKAALVYEHSNKAIANDNPGNIGTISTVRDIKATLVHAYREMVNSGVVENVTRFGELLEVVRDTSNPNRVNILAPVDMANPLDIFAANVRVYSQFRNAA
jgi:phage tail sheath gpL-like